MRPATRFTGSVGLLLGLVCCGGCSEKSGQPAAATDAALTGEPSTTSCTGKGTPFVLPLTAETPNREFAVTITDATPPDFGMGDNAWTVRVDDAGGHPAPGSSFKVNPWMPEHKHGAVKIVVVTDSGEGAYDVKPINVNMPGVWEIRFDFPSDGGAGLRAVFSLCALAR